MNDEKNSENTYRVLDLIAQSPSLSQRELATSAGLSLGLVNLIIKRLTNTGYIKVLNLNNRKVEYLLTTKGAMEKAKRTSHYISRTVQTYMEYQKRITQLLSDLAKEGRACFALIGQGEIAALVEMRLKEMDSGIKYRHLKPGEQAETGETVLDCRLGQLEDNVGVSVLERLLSQ